MSATSHKAAPRQGTVDTLKQARKTGALNWGARAAAKVQDAQRPGFTAKPNLIRGMRNPSAGAPAQKLTTLQSQKSQHGALFKSSTPLADPAPK